MKTFLDTWLLDAQSILGQELAGAIELRTAGELPRTADSLSCQVELQGGLRGSFWVVVEADALSRMLIAARITDAEPDSERDVHLWTGILRQIAAKAAKSASAESGAPVSVAIVQVAARPAGAALTGYSLRFGEAVLPLAFSDQTHPHVVEASVVPPPARGIELLLDVELEASLRFGSKEMPLSEVLDLGPGDVVQLERHVSDPVDLIVGDKIVARGEVVLVNGNFGLRVTEVAEPRKSLESIRCLF